MNGLSLPDEVEVLEAKESWSEYRLADGRVLRVRPIMIAVSRVGDADSANGEPAYNLKSTLITDIREAKTPEEKSVSVLDPPPQRAHALREENRQTLPESSPKPAAETAEPSLDQPQEAAPTEPEKPAPNSTQIDPLSTGGDDQTKKQLDVERAGSASGVSLFITQAQKAKLRERGFADEELRNMLPVEAHRILGLNSSNVS